MYVNLILFQQTPEVTKYNDYDEWINAEGQEVVTEQLESFLKFGKTRKNMLGLAANQISIDGIRFNANCFIDNFEDRMRIVIQPKIISYEGEISTKLERCLTWPRKRLVSKRYESVIVEYYDTENIKYQKEVTGLEAQLWQHEIDHLNGVEEIFYEDFDKKNKAVNRNDKCPCGSGLKYKKCCME